MSNFSTIYTSRKSTDSVGLWVLLSVSVWMFSWNFITKEEKDVVYLCARFFLG